MGGSEFEVIEGSVVVEMPHSNVSLDLLHRTHLTDSFLLEASEVLPDHNFQLLEVGHVLLSEGVAPFFFPLLCEHHLCVVEFAAFWQMFLEEGVVSKLGLARDAADQVEVATI